MREIKFRAWDKKNKKFVPVKSIVFNSVTSEIKGCYVEEQSGRGYILDDVGLTQYTGLKDKNGKEIYEGDIVRGKNDKIWEITFDWGSFGAELKMYDYKQISDWLSSATISFQDEQFVIIGNIYENPELITPKE